VRRRARGRGTLVAMSATTKPRVLVVYYTYTQQTLKVAEAMADVLVERGCDVRLAGIEFTDPRYSERFTRSP
jgi:menaquinone-dependent protoporphyrinogen IX oxidase